MPELLNPGLATGHSINRRSKLIFSIYMPLRYASECCRWTVEEAQGGPSRQQTHGTLRQDCGGDTDEREAAGQNTLSENSVTCRNN